MRFILLAGLLSGIEAALPLLDGLLPIPQRLFAVLTLFAVAAAFVARLIAQNNLKGIEDAINKIRSSSRAKAAIAAVILSASASGWLAFSFPDRITPASVHSSIEQGITPPAVELAVNKLIIPWEGLVLQSHWDSFAKIWDICYGETRINGKPVTAGMSFTPAECLAMLKVRFTQDYYLPLVDGVKGYVEAPVSVQASLLSGAYNFGVFAAKRSTAARLTTAGKYRQACEAQTAFNKAGGKVVNGLALRREMGDKQRLGETSASTALSSTVT